MTIYINYVAIESFEFFIQRIPVSYTHLTTQLIRDQVEEQYKGKYQTIETFPGTIELMYSGFSKGRGLEMY